MGEPIHLRNPEATRPWQHVLEPISGYLLLAARLLDDPEKYKGAWNFGPPSSEVRTVLEVAEHMVEGFGRGKIISSVDDKTHHEAQLLQLNCDKAHQLLGWYPRWDVDKTLEATTHWYKTILEGGEAEELTREQLNDYFPELL